MLRRTLTFIAAGVLLSVSACTGAQPTKAADAVAVEVSVVTARRETVPLRRELPGRISARRVAEVRARISGILLKRNFEPGFKVALMNKDLETFHAIAKELHVPVSFSNLAQRYQQAALAAGLGEKDTSVIFTLIEQSAGLKPGIGK